MLIKSLKLDRALEDLTWWDWITREIHIEIHSYTGIGFGRVGPRGHPSSQAEVVRALPFRV